MKFADLDDEKKITHIKDKYAEIIGEIVADKSIIDKLLPEEKEPVFVKPDLSEAGEEDKKNQAILKNAKLDFEVKTKAYKENKEVREKIVEALSKIKEKTDCICEPRELDIDINYIVPEFEVFIDLARKRAEEQTY